MKTLYLMPILALAAIDANASNSIPMQADLTLKLPTCTLKVAATGDTIAAAYTVEQGNIDLNNAGTYSFSTPSAKFVVSTDEACPTVPGFNFTFSPPAERSGNDRYITSHGVNWYMQAYVVDVLGYDDPDGNGNTINLAGKYKVKNSDKSTDTRTWNRLSPGEQGYYSATVGGKNIKYIHSKDAMLRNANGKQYWSTSYSPIVASSVDGYQTTVTPGIPQATASVSIELGLMVDPDGPMVGSVHDQSSAINGLVYGYTGQLTVTAI